MRSCTSLGPPIQSRMSEFVIVNSCLRVRSKAHLGGSLGGSEGHSHGGRQGLFRGFSHRVAPRDHVDRNLGVCEAATSGHMPGTSSGSPSQLGLVKGSLSRLESFRGSFLRGSSSRLGAKGTSDSIPSGSEHDSALRLSQDQIERGWSQVDSPGQPEEVISKESSDASDSLAEATKPRRGQRNASSPPAAAAVAPKTRTCAQSVVKKPVAVEDKPKATRRRSVSMGVTAIKKAPPEKPIPASAKPSATSVVKKRVRKRGVTKAMPSATSTSGDEAAGPLPEELPVVEKPGTKAMPSAISTNGDEAAGPLPEVVHVVKKKSHKKLVTPSAISTNGDEAAGPLPEVVHVVKKKSHKKLVTPSAISTDGDEAAGPLPEVASVVKKKSHKKLVTPSAISTNGDEAAGPLPEVVPVVKKRSHKKLVVPSAISTNGDEAARLKPEDVPVVEKQGTKAMPSATPTNGDEAAGPLPEEVPVVKKPVAKATPGAISTNGDEAAGPLPEEVPVVVKQVRKKRVTKAAPTEVEVVPDEAEAKLPAMVMSTQSESRQIRRNVRAGLASSQVEDAPKRRGRPKKVKPEDAVPAPTPAVDAPKQTLGSQESVQPQEALASDLSSSPLVSLGTEAGSQLPSTPSSHATTSEPELGTPAEESSLGSAPLGSFEPSDLSSDGLSTSFLDSFPPDSPVEGVFDSPAAAAGALEGKMRLVESLVQELKDRLKVLMSMKDIFKSGPPSRYELYEGEVKRCRVLLLESSATLKAWKEAVDKE
eukprot:gene18987-25569_t